MVTAHRDVASAARLPRLDLAGILVANLAMLFFYFYFELTLLQLVFVFWWECAWIGVFAWLKLLVLSIAGKPYDTRTVEVSRGAGLLLTLLLMSFVGAKYFALLGGIGLVLVAVAIEVLEQDLRTVLDALVDPVLAVALWLFLSHLTLFVGHFLLGRGFRNARWLPLIGWSYARYGAMALAMAAGLAWLAAYPAAGGLFAAVIVTVKVAADCLLTRLELGAEPDARTAGPDPSSIRG